LRASQDALRTQFLNFFPQFFHKYTYILHVLISITRFWYYLITFSSVTNVLTKLIISVFSLCYVSQDLCSTMYSNLSSSCDRLKFNRLTLTVIRKNGNILILEKDKNKPILLISCPKDTADPLSINYLSKAICDAQAVKTSTDLLLL